MSILFSFPCFLASFSNFCKALQGSSFRTIWRNVPGSYGQTLLFKLGSPVKVCDNDGDGQGDAKHLLDKEPCRQEQWQQYSKLLYTSKKATDKKVGGFRVCLSVGVIWILPPNCKDREILCIVLPRRWRKGNQQVFLPQLSVRCPHTLSKQHFSKPSDDFTCAGHGDDRPVEGLGAEVDNNIIQGWQTRLWVFC